jgi:hypothetical protein
MCGSKIQKCCIANEKFLFIVEELQRHVDMVEMELIGVVARNLRLRWNAVVYEKTVSLYTTVVSNAYDSLVAFRDANSRKYSNKLAENLEIRWKASLEGFVNVNWDAPINKNKIKMSIGVIIRNRMGEELATLIELKDYIIAPDVVEATVVLRATKFNSELEFYKVFLDGYALQIVQKLKKYG